MSRSCCRSLAGVYEDLGSNAEAEALRLRGLAILEKLLGLDRPELRPTPPRWRETTRSNSGLAKPNLCLREPLPFEKALGRENSDTAWTMALLGELYRRQSQLAQAEFVLKRALAIQERTLGERRIETAVTLQSLGRCTPNAVTLSWLMRSGKKELGPLSSPHFAISISQ